MADEKKYLDDKGLETLWEQTKKLVEEGSGTSTTSVLNMGLKYSDRIIYPDPDGPLLENIYFEDEDNKKYCGQYVIHEVFGDNVEIFFKLRTADMTLYIDEDGIGAITSPEDESYYMYMSAISAGFHKYLLTVRVYDENGKEITDGSVIKNGCEFFRLAWSDGNDYFQLLAISSADGIILGNVKDVIDRKYLPGKDPEDPDLVTSAEFYTIIDEINSLYAESVNQYAESYEKLVNQFDDLIKAQGFVYVNFFVVEQNTNSSLDPSILYFDTNTIPTILSFNYRNDTSMQLSSLSYNNDYGKYQLSYFTTSGTKTINSRAVYFKAQCYYIYYLHNASMNQATEMTQNYLTLHGEFKFDETCNTIYWPISPTSNDMDFTTIEKDPKGINIVMVGYDINDFLANQDSTYVKGTTYWFNEDTDDTIARINNGEFDIDE